MEQYLYFYKKSMNHRDALVWAGADEKTFKQWLEDEQFKTDYQIIHNQIQAFRFEMSFLSSIFQ